MIPAILFPNQHRLTLKAAVEEDDEIHEPRENPRLKSLWEGSASLTRLAAGFSWSPGSLFVCFVYFVVSATPFRFCSVAFPDHAIGSEAPDFRKTAVEGVANCTGQLPDGRLAEGCVPNSNAIWLPAVHQTAVWNPVRFPSLTLALSPSSAQRFEHGCIVCSRSQQLSWRRHYSRAPALGLAMQCLSI